MPKNRFPQFTLKEIDLINEMLGIAQGGDMNEGDYQGWEDDWHYGAVKSLEDKVASYGAELERRTKAHI